MLRWASADRSWALPSRPIAAPRGPSSAGWLRLGEQRSALEDAAQAAREDPANAQALYDLLAIGCRTPRAIEKLLANLDELGIPTRHLSHKKDLAPFA